MMDIDLATILKEWASFGVGGLLAVVIFHWYRKDVQQYTELWRGQSESLILCVKEVTVAITSNTETVRAFHRRLDRLQGFEDGERERERKGHEERRDADDRRLA